MSDSIRKILVATDFSPCSVAALDLAATLGSDLDATIDLIHVWSDRPAFAAAMVGSGKPEDAVEKLHQDAKAALKKFADAASKRGIEINDTHMRRGNSAADELIDVAQEYDLLITGTHGRTGVPHFFLGSVAERVVRGSTTPVLTVRSHDE